MIVFYEKATEKLVYTVLEDQDISNPPEGYGAFFVSEDTVVTQENLAELIANYTPSGKELQYAKVGCKQQINQIREVKLITGFQFTFPNTQGVGKVPLTPNDILTINGLATTAMLCKDIPGFSITYRDADNNNFTMNATETMNFAVQCSVAVSTIYTESWNKKSQIDNCTTVEGVKAIQW